MRAPAVIKNTALYRGIRYLAYWFYSRRSKMTRSHWRWLQDGGDQALKYDFPITSNATVFDLGGYHAEWTKEIKERYNPKSVYIFEPVADYADICKKICSEDSGVKVFECGLGHKDDVIDLAVDENKSGAYAHSKDHQQVEIKQAHKFFSEHNIDRIDLMKINIEGAEYPLIKHFIDTNDISKINHLLVQFHNFVPNAEDLYEALKRELQETHEQVWCYPFVWEYWRKKT